MKDRRKLAYWIFLAGLLLFCMTYLPYLTDYYVIQPEESAASYYLSNVLNEYYRYEGIVIALSMLAVWLLSQRAGVSVLAVVLPLWLLDYASLIKYKARGEFLRLGDLALTEAAGVAVKYLELQFAPAQLVVVGSFLLLTVSGFVLDRQGRKLFGDSKRMKLYVRLLGAACCLGISVWYTLSFFTEKNRIESVSAMNITENNYDRYVLYNFLKNDGLTKIGPDDLEGSLRFFTERSMGDGDSGQYQYPNVIVIMSESWWNTDNIKSEKIAFSKDPMEPYKTVGESCSSGYLTSDIFGGGTTSSEAEFLSGLNAKYGTQIYGKLGDGSVPSLFTYFKALDYETAVIHPYYGEFYSRNKIYANIGADKMIFEEDMDYREIYSMYISDESLAKQIIKEYEERGKEQCFIYSISVANHNEVLVYTTQRVENYAYPIDVSIQDAELSSFDEHVLVNYVNGIYLAGKAFVQLTEYFSGQREPTVIVMYGDHIPGFSGEALDVMGLGDRGDRDVLKRLYSVPVLMWSNYDCEEVCFTGENIAYLPQMLIEYARLPGTDMTDILSYERSIFKTDSLHIVEGPDGRPIEVCDRTQMEALKHYRVIEYGILHGYEECKDLWLPHTVERNCEEGELGIDSSGKY